MEEDGFIAALDRQGTSRPPIAVFQRCRAAKVYGLVGGTAGALLDAYLRVGALLHESTSGLSVDLRRSALGLS